MTRLTSHDLIDLVLDEGSWRSWDEAPAYGEISEQYAAELAAAREKAGTDEAVVTGEGVLRGRRVAVVLGEFGFLAGSIGRATADRLVATIKRATTEGLLMRGYVLRLLLQWQEERRDRAEAFAEVWERRSVHEVLAGAASPLAVLGSSAVFALGHAPAAWPAAALYGLLMAGLWIVRKDLLSCVAAHATTNLCLALWVRASGHWNLW